MEELSLDDFQSVINVNLVGSFLAAREAMKVFKSQSPQGGRTSIFLVKLDETADQSTMQNHFSGRIINNGSLSAHVPRPNTSPYACSKHGITGLTKCIALEGRPFNITCTQLDIGTGFSRTMQLI